MREGARAADTRLRVLTAQRWCQSICPTASRRRAISLAGPRRAALGAATLCSAMTCGRPPSPKEPAMRFAPLLLTLAVALATPAGATTIVVTPGPGTPLQDAIDAAPPGATLIASGTFHEPGIVIDKALT